VLTAPVAGALAGALREAGFLVNAVQPDVVRLAPPLIFSAEQADAFVTAVSNVDASAVQGGTK
jgi:acetylornithine aminotransferase